MTSRPIFTPEVAVAVSYRGQSYAVRYHRGRPVSLAKVSGIGPLWTSPIADLPENDVVAQEVLRAAEGFVASLRPGARA